MDAAPPTTLDFLDRLGVGVHLEYTDGKYADIGQVIGDLAYLGLDRVRDANLDPRNQGQTNYALAAQAGIKFDLVVNPAYPPPQTLDMASAFALAHPGAVTALEGPNEVNNWPVTFNGATGPAAAVAYQAALYAAAKAHPVLKSTPVYNLTAWPDLGAAADFATVHSYPKNADQPWSELSSNLANQAKVMPGKPIVLTEIGYYTLTNGVGWGGVDQATQAKMTLNLLFDAAKLGVRQVYLYQLLDAYADPQQSDQEKHFGLFDIDNQPKAAATAIHNLTAIFRSGAVPGASGGAPSYSLQGPGGDVSSLVYRKAPGVYDLVVWREPDIWDQAARKPLAAPAEAVQLALPAAARLSVYDPLQGAAPRQVVSGARLSLALADHPVIVEVAAGP